jgi:hypothetical protein
MPGVVPSNIAHARASLARRTQSYAPGHPRLVEARRNLATEQIASYIGKVVAEAPPLTREQLDRLHVLLEPARAELTAGGNAVDAA